MTQFNLDQLKLVITTAFGLESIVTRELKDLGYDQVVTENGYVTLTAGIKDICVLNLWIRCGERVYLELANFPCADFGILFDEVAQIPWEKIIPATAEIPVHARSVKSELTSTPHIQSITKKSIVTRLLKHYPGTEFPESGPVFRVECVLQQNQMRILLDTSGDGLHKRGYRQQTAAAPLRETLAAALVELSYWEPGRLLMDPFCGSGTILIEAALAGRNIAPGTYRGFAAERWPLFPTGMWHHVRLDAKSKVISHAPLGMQGYDIDNQFIASARNNARLAGVEQDIHFQLRDVRGLSTPHKYGCMITNPPWGERLEDQDHAAELMDLLGEKTQDWETWSIYILSAIADFERIYGYTADRRRKLYHARIECTYYQYLGPKPPLKTKLDENLEHTANKSSGLGADEAVWDKEAKADETNDSSMQDDQAVT